MKIRKTIPVPGILLRRISFEERPIFLNENGIHLERDFIGSYEMYIAPLKLDHYDTDRDFAELYIESIQAVSTARMMEFCNSVTGYVMFSLIDDFDKFTDRFRIKVVLFSNKDIYDYYGFVYLGNMRDKSKLPRKEAEKIRYDEADLFTMLSRYIK